MANEPVQATTLAMNALDQQEVLMSLAALEHAKPPTDRLSGTFYAAVEIIKDTVEHHN
jgi:hypothetical protein